MQTRRQKHSTMNYPQLALQHTPVPFPSPQAGGPLIVGDPCLLPYSSNWGFESSQLE